jgi:hypothetical protein
MEQMIEGPPENLEIVIGMMGQVLKRDDEPRQSIGKADDPFPKEDGVKPAYSPCIFFDIFFLPNGRRRETVGKNREWGRSKSSAPGKPALPNRRI